MRLTGDPLKGMSLGDVRQFVTRTSNLPEGTWVDCLVPSGDPLKPMLAALMGLEAS